MVDLTAGASIPDGTELLEIPTTHLKSGSASWLESLGLQLSLSSLNRRKIMGHFREMSA